MSTKRGQPQGPLSGGCRVVYVVDEPNQRGFAYGTLQGHPESGEEFFGVRFDPTNEKVYAQVVAFSRPGQWWSKPAAWLGSVVQRRVTDRYLGALMALIEDAPTPGLVVMTMLVFK